MLIYLHGFRSGPQSFKSRQLVAHMQRLGLGDVFWGAQLQWGPAAAIAQISNVIEDSLNAGKFAPTLVGSSLGGFYATYLAERYALRAAVINPAVLSHVSLGPHLGPQEMIYTGERFDFTAAHLEELRALETGALREPSRFWLLAETGDEVLDYRHAVARYAGARQTVLAGGGHSFTRWGDYLDDILVFAGLSPV